MKKKIFSTIVLASLVLSLIAISPVTSKEEVLVKVGFQDDMKGLNPVSVGFNDVWSAFEQQWCWDSLYTWSPDYTVIPWIAAGDPVYEDLPDGKVLVTVKLREDVKWWDGKPLTAEDVAFTLNMEKDYQLPLQYPSFLLGTEEYVEKIEAVDTYTVQYTLTSPNAAFPTTILMHGILPKHQWEPVVEAAEAAGGDIAAKGKYIQDFDLTPDNVIGSGPFKPTEWVKGSHIKLEANKDYFKKGEVVHCEAGDFEIGPHIDGILIKVYKSLDALMLAVAKGDVDYMRWPIDPGRLAEFMGKPNIELPVSDDCGFFYLAFNFRKPPCDDPAFRKAVSYLTDKDFIVNRLLQGYGSPLWGPVVPGNAYYYNADVVKYGDGLDREARVAKAKEVLADAGYTWDSKGNLILPDGTPMPAMDILTPPADYDPVRAMAGVLIQEWCREVGMNITAKPTSFGTIVNLVFPDEGIPEFDMYILGWSIGFDPLPTIQSIFHSSQRPEVLPGGANAMGYVNPEFDAVVDEAMRTLDDEKRRELILKMQDILAEDLPYINLYAKKIIEVYRTDNVV